MKPARIISEDSLTGKIKLPSTSRPRYNDFMVTLQSLKDELHEAMRSGDSLKKQTLRMVLSAVKLAEVEKRQSLEEDEILAVLQKEAKSRAETIAEAKGAGRDDIVQETEKELKLLQNYLPAAMSPEELDKEIKAAIEESGAEGPQDMGKVMKIVMARVKLRADGKEVSTRVRALLSN